MSVHDFKDRFVVVAHRGYSARYRDNSLEGTLAAIEARADVIETDIRMSSDGILVCEHENRIATHVVSSMTAAALQERKVMLFSDFMEAVKGKALPLLDLKEKRPSFVTNVLTQVRAHGMEEEAIIGVRTLTQTSRLRDESDKVAILGFLEDPAEFPEFYQRGGNIARLWEGNVTPGNLKLAEAAKGPVRKPVWAMAGFYPNDRIRKYGDIDRQSLFNLMSWGVKGVIVNDPVLAHDAVRARNAPSPQCGSFAGD